MARKLTMKMLKDAYACSGQRRKFYNRFRNGTTVTLAKCLKYQDAFPFRWGVNLLTGRQSLKFERIVDEQDDLYARKRQNAELQNELGRISYADYCLAKIEFQKQRNRALVIPFYKAFNGKL